MKGSKGKNRPTAERWRLYTKSRSHGHSRRSRGEERHDFYGGNPPARILERIQLREMTLELIEASCPEPAEPFFQKENIGTVSFGGSAPTKAKRRTGRSTPWDGMAATLPWGVPGSPRTSACI